MKMFRAGMVLFLILFLPWSETWAQTPPGFKLLDVFHLEYASDPQIDPAGKRVVYVRNSMDNVKDRRRSALWIVQVDGSDHRPLTSMDRDESSPRWSPDGQRLAFVVRSENRHQLRCRWMDTGQECKVADLTSPPTGLAWSPDGKLLAFAMIVPEKGKPLVELPAPPKGGQWADPPKEIRKVFFRLDGKGYLPDGYTQIFVAPFEGGTPRQLTSGSFHHPDPYRSPSLSWTPDGKAILFSANLQKDWELDPLNTEVCELSLDDGSIKTLTSRKGPDHHPSISPDGKTIAYLGFDDKRQGYQPTKLNVMPRDGKGPKPLLPELDRDVVHPTWGKNGVFFQYDDQGNTRIGYTALDGKMQTIADNVGGTTLDRPYASGSFSVSKDGSVAFTYSPPDHPAEVAVVASGDSKPRKVTSLNASLFSQRTLGKVEEIWFKSSHDGRKVHGWIVKPPHFDPKKKYPLILEIHGGPFANYGPRFAADMQLYAAARYVVLYVNPRGSTSYGQEFGNLIHHNYPGNDYDDLMSAVDHVIKMGFVDENNLFVTGGSGGGVLTAWIIGRTGRFRAAVVGKPVINWYSFVLTADIYPFFAQYWFPGPPWEQAEHYLKRSPISLAGNIKTPTMILTGENDLRTPMSESEQLYQALKLRKVETILVRIPGAFHDIAARPSQMMAKAAYTMKWFDMHRAGQ